VNQKKSTVPAQRESTECNQEREQKCCHRVFSNDWDIGKKVEEQFPVNHVEDLKVSRQERVS